jgi:hypothetical protein
MSTTDPTRSRPAVRQYSGERSPERYAYARDDGEGWVAFAGA